MRVVLRSLSIVAVATRRLFAQRGLALATAVGLVAAVAIVMSIPLYTDAVYYRVLREELTRPEDQSALARPPFAFMYRYVGSLYGTKEWEDVEQVDVYLTENAPDILALPHQWTTRYFRTENFRLYPTGNLEYADVTDPIDWINFTYATDFENHVNLIEGRLPAPSGTSVDSVVEVLVAQPFAEEYGIQVGEEYVTFRRSDEEGRRQVVQIPVRISGIWAAKDPLDPYWFYRLSVYDTHFFVPEETFMQRIATAQKGEISQALWYLVFDGSHITSGDVGWLLSRIVQTQQQAASLLTNTRLEISPLDALAGYRRSARILNILLYAFSIPIIGLLLAFIGLVVGLSVGRQRNEIAVLRSRGATALQVVGIAALEALLLGVVALAAGLPVSEQIARTIGATQSFLHFGTDAGLRVTTTVSTLRIGIIAVAITMVAQIFPSFGASKHTIVSYKNEQSRTVRAPWWQRAWLDFLLLIPAAYGTYLLSQQGSISTPLSESGGSAFDNPLLFLIPSLGALALALLTLRLLPLIMSAMSWIASRGNSVGFLLATRYLARDPAFYGAPLVLLILTLSLSTFTASLARTLDAHLYDSNYYKVGADGRLAELGQIAPVLVGPGEGQTESQEGSAVPAMESETVIEEDRWVFVPVSEHLRLPDIHAATRVGEFDASIQVQGTWKDTEYLGIDRLDFPQVAYWRYDFAPASLGALMNALAVTPDAVLLPRAFMRENAIRVGETVTLRITTRGERIVMTGTVVGDFEHFPTWYPEEEDAVPLVVGNLEYFFEEAGGLFPYDVLIKTTPEADFDQLADDLRDLDITVMSWKSARAEIAEEQNMPERQGLFGVLSVGFLASALLTVLGFFLYALFSFRRRFIELGTLRAIGLSAGQMTTFLAWELAFVIFLGLAAGTVIGGLISSVYIPFLQVGGDAQSITPPFLVEIAWPAILRIYLLFVVMFLVALAVLAVLLMRMKVFQAIKLGETV